MKKIVIGTIAVVLVSASGSATQQSSAARLVAYSNVSRTAAVLAAQPAQESQEKRYIEPAGHPTEVYWGDAHVHTSFSLDAAAWGNSLLPQDTYRFAKGEVVTSFKGWQAQMTRPYDWMVIADHSDGYNFTNRLYAGDPWILDQELGQRWYDLLQEGGDEARPEVADELIRVLGSGTDIWDLASPEMLGPGWELTVAAAEEANDPGVFTAFIGYEWSSAPGGDNLHRVVIYRDDADKALQTLPLTMTETVDPEDLWDVLEAYEEKTGGQVLAIAHNGNWSSGRMFDDVRWNGEPLDQSYVERRIRWEPVYETTQIKGDGETHVLLSPDDEFADYETWDVGNLSFSRAVTPDMLARSYTREALKRGLGYEARLGTNPWQFGLIGSGDSHTGLPSMDENNFMGKSSSSEPDAERWETPFRSTEIGTQPGWSEVASGIAGIWASENTRTALWDALKRKEVYATTGSRISVRVFGGWDFEYGDDRRSDYVALGYERGIPMGGVLPRNPHSDRPDFQGLSTALRTETEGPSFLVVALKDPIGGNLDRVQMIKGWHDADGELHEKVYDIAWGDAESRYIGADGKLSPVGNTVDIPDASWTNTIGEVQLSTVWQDPDFDNAEQAFYYVRVLEIPTPRWTAYDAKRFGVTMGPEVPMINQERAYTSPIWYVPG